jgi:hypothetical protein
MPIEVAIYTLFIAPFLYFIPYLLAKLKTKKQKILFIFLGLIIPYLLIYIFTYLDLSKPIGWF